PARQSFGRICSSRGALGDHWLTWIFNCNNIQSISICHFLDFDHNWPQPLKAEPNMTKTFEPIRRLHHFAWRCRDAEETRAFYEDILCLPLTHIVRADKRAQHRGEPPLRAPFLRSARWLFHCLL